jgi:hypothetical protein
MNASLRRAMRGGPYQPSSIARKTDFAVDGKGGTYTNDGRDTIAKKTIAVY